MLTFFINSILRQNFKSKILCFILFLFLKIRNKLKFYKILIFGILLFNLVTCYHSRNCMNSNIYISYPFKMYDIFSSTNTHLSNFLNIFN